MHDTLHVSLLGTSAATRQLLKLHTALLRSTGCSLERRGGRFIAMPAVSSLYPGRFAHVIGNHRGNHKGNHM